MQEDGQLTADPEVVDGRAREAWQKVYQGMPGLQEELVTTFFETYAEDLPPRQEPGSIPRVTSEDVHYAFGKVADNSAGPEMWRPRELRWLGPICCGWIAEIFNVAERRAGLAGGP